MRHENSVFSAKILLFGEYSVIFDSRALTIPYSYFNGHLSFIGEDKYTRYDMAIQSNAELIRYQRYLTGNGSLVGELVSIWIDCKTISPTDFILNPIFLRDMGSVRREPWSLLYTTGMLLGKSAMSPLKR